MASLASAGKFAWRLGGTTLGVGVIVLVLGGAGLWIWLDRVDSLRDAHSTALRLVHVLGEQTERTVQTVDLILTRLADTLGSAPDLPDHDPAFQDKMRALLHPSPFIRALFVVGPDGFLTHDTNHPNTPPVSAADRDYFMAHAQRDDFDLFIGMPLQSRRVGTWFVSVSRRVPSADGSFAGIVVAAVEPRYFEQFYGGLRLGATDSIALFRRDGTLVARYPHVGTAIGQSYASYEPFKSQLETMSTGSFETDGVIGGWARVLAYRTVDGTPLVVAVGLDKQNLLADWQQRALITSGSALGIALLGAASVIFLIRHQRERAAVRQHLAQAQKLDAVGQMAAGIVHDFRNLLAVVASGGRLLRRRVPNPALTPILDEIEAAVERGTTLTSKLLAFSRQQELDLEVVDVNQLLNALQPLMKSATRPGVRLELRLAPEVWPCRLDRTQFDRALLNLIINARDAMPKGGELRVATANFSERAGLGKSACLGRAMLPPNDYVRVWVADNGQGMTREVARRILEPFYTTKGKAGTGLGLSQVYGFVRQVGGDLRIESGLGAGTTVELFFPRQASVRSTAAADHEEAAQDASNRHRQPGNVRGKQSRARDGRPMAPRH